MKRSLLLNKQQVSFDQDPLEEEIQNINADFNPQRKKQLSQSFNRKQRFLKLICVAFLLSGFVYYRFIHSLSDSTHSVFDSYQQYTFSINRKLYEGWDNAALGIGQVMMDGWIVSSAIFWYFLHLFKVFFKQLRLIRVQTFRFPFTVATFYGIRSLFLLIQKFPFPQNMVWHSPGFYSLTVPYDHTRDFFYSGHTGALTMILLQFSQFTVKKSKRLQGYIWVFAFVCLIFMMNMLIITRVHYTIDIVGGLVFSIYFYWLVSYYQIWVDKLSSIPYNFIIQPLIQKYRKRKLQNQANKNSKSQPLQNIVKDELQQ